MVLVSYISFILYSFGISVGVKLTKEGCDNGWKYYREFCYEFNVHPVQFVTAKEICSTKDAELVSIWNSGEEDFITNTLWQGLDKTQFAWIGILTDPEEKKQRLSWVDGSISDVDSKDLQATDTVMCGVMKGTGERRFWYCEERIPAFICKKSLRMVYVVSEVFNSSYITSYQTEEPERLLFERVWPPKLQSVPTYIERIASTQVSEETDCANRCFHVDDCRGFMLTCIHSWKCNQYNCELYKPSSH